MDAVRPEDAEVTLLITTQIKKTARAACGAGECNRMNRAAPRLLFVFDGYPAIELNGVAETEIGKSDEIGRRHRGGELILKLHLSIETKRMYPFK